MVLMSMETVEVVPEGEVVVRVICLSDVIGSFEVMQMYK
jgi:hypothetical protein